MEHRTFPSSEMAQLIDWEKYGLTEKKIRVLQAQSSESTDDLRSTISTRMKFLLTLGIKDIKDVISKHYRVLLLSPQVLQKRITYLRKIGIHDVPRVVALAPRILSTPLINLQNHVQCLKQRRFHDIGPNLIKFPRLLFLDVDNILTPGLEFLQHTFQLPIGHIESHLHLFSFSLTKIQECVTFLSDLGIRVGALALPQK